MNYVDVLVCDGGNYNQRTILVLDVTLILDQTRQTDGVSVHSSLAETTEDGLVET